MQKRQRAHICIMKTQLRGSFWDMKKEIKLTTYSGPGDTSSTSGLSDGSPRLPQLAGRQQAGDWCVCLVRTFQVGWRQSKRQICTVGGNFCTGQQRFHRAPAGGACLDASSQWSDRLGAPYWLSCRGMKCLRRWLLMLVAGSWKWLSVSVEKGFARLGVLWDTKGSEVLTDIVFSCSRRSIRKRIFEVLVMELKVEW